VALNGATLAETDNGFRFGEAYGYETCRNVYKYSTIADKLHDTFRSQSRSPNMVPYDVRYGLQ